MPAPKKPTGDRIRIADVVVAAFPEKVFHRGIPVTPTGKFSAQVVDAEGNRHWARSLDTVATKASAKTRAAAKPDAPAKRTTRKAPAKKAPARKTTTKK